MKTPAVPQANYNQVTFPQLTAQRVRVLMTRTGNFGIGLKEIQISVRDPLLSRHRVDPSLVLR
ncbi:MAG TPA: hypothetical protein VFR23_15530 [Jiangellaceae bacterium]|nr:hypothetical protein [Jiangellaceae bacterium]